MRCASRSCMTGVQCPHGGMPSPVTSSNPDLRDRVERNVIMLVGGSVAEIKAAERGLYIVESPPGRYSIRLRSTQQSGVPPPEGCPKIHPWSS